MCASKKKCLEKKGWKVGDAAEFLDLSPEESAYIELKLKLAESLRNRRRRRRMTQVQVARLVRSSQSRVAKMEAGDPSVSVDLLIRSLLALGASRHDVGRIIGEPERAQAG
jgi:predicted metal-binding transcription factor (methanogenesis marker protein 9)